MEPIIRLGKLNKYNKELLNTRILFTKAKGGALVPDQVEYETKDLDHGAMIQIEVVENGYIFSKGDRKVIETSGYSLRDALETFSLREFTHTRPYIEEEWEDYDMINKTIELNAKTIKSKNKEN